MRRCHQGAQQARVLTIWKRPGRTCGRAWRPQRWGRAGRSGPPAWPTTRRPGSPACWSRSLDLHTRHSVTSQQITAHHSRSQQIRAKEPQRNMWRNVRLAHSLMALNVSLKFSLFGTRYRISSVTRQPGGTRRRAFKRGRGAAFILCSLHLSRPVLLG